MIFPYLHFIRLSLHSPQKRLVFYQKLALLREVGSAIPQSQHSYQTRWWQRRFFGSNCLGGDNKVGYHEYTRLPLNSYLSKLSFPFFFSIHVVGSWREKTLWIKTIISKSWFKKQMPHRKIKVLTSPHSTFSYQLKHASSEK